MKYDVYLLLYPGDINAANARNYHILRAQYDDKLNKYLFPYGTTTLCNGYEKKLGVAICSSQQMKFDDEVVRIKLAENQNSGLQICANCVKRFYADDDEQ